MKVCFRHILVYDFFTECWLAFGYHIRKKQNQGRIFKICYLVSIDQMWNGVRQKKAHNMRKL